MVYLETCNKHKTTLMTINRAELLQTHLTHQQQISYSGDNTTVTLLAVLKVGQLLIGDWDLMEATLHTSKMANIKIEIQKSITSNTFKTAISEFIGPVITNSNTQKK